MRSSFLSADLEALTRSVNWEWTAGDVEIVPGVRVEVTGGHTEHHQSVVVSGDSDTLLFPGDLIPTRAHLRPYWIMAYDMFPYDTFVRKQELARRACDNRWIVAWDHAPDALEPPRRRRPWRCCDPSRFRHVKATSRQE